MRRLALALLLALSCGAARAAAQRPFDATSWQAILREHAGHATLVHFWAMTCGPCRVDMPKLGTLLAHHPGVEVVTVDTDLVAAPPGGAEAFLRTAGMPTREAWRFADPFAEKLYFSVDPAWQGEIPRTLLIDRRARVTVVTGTGDDAIEEWLNEHGL